MILTNQTYDMGTSYVMRTKPDLSRGIQCNRTTQFTRDQLRKTPAKAVALT